MMQKKSSFARRLERLAKFSEQELACINELEASSAYFERGSEIFSEGEMSRSAYIVQRGWGCSFKLSLNGERQIIAIILPGDCVDLRCTLRQTNNYTFLAVTDLTVARVPAGRIEQILNKLPHLGVAMLLATAQSDEMIVDHLMSLGRRTAIERLAHLFLELIDRLSIVGLATETTFDCPLTQYDLADTLGLSAIHVNRMLRELRERKMMSFTDHKVELLDVGKLQELTGYHRCDNPPLIVRGGASQSDVR